MARSLSINSGLAKALSDGIALVITRREYSVASAAARKAAEKAAVTKGKRDSPTMDSAASSSWVPDPVTGYYRPANRLVEVDAAELREVLLSRKPSRA